MGYMSVLSLEYVRTCASESTDMFIKKCAFLTKKMRINWLKDAHLLLIKCAFIN
jgi:hypothetical protein